MSSTKSFTVSSTLLANEENEEEPLLGLLFRVAEVGESIACMLTGRFVRDTIANAKGIR